MLIQLLIVLNQKGMKKKLRFLIKTNAHHVVQKLV
ncbi:hypothetical protein LLT7_06835 [Lactococcus cremoris subsp. cremoris TIFN7]|nr:hypothetical protein LLT7_06835 [Lactococcus cremoris subsp. cremoris TIFN7]